MPCLTMIHEESSLREFPFEDRLAARLMGATCGRLRFLRVACAGGQVAVWGAAPSYHVRQLAEQAALSLVPAARLQLEIEVQPMLRLHESEFEPAV